MAAVDLCVTCPACHTRVEHLNPDHVRWHTPPPQPVTPSDIAPRPRGFYTWQCPTCGPTRQIVWPVVEPLLARAGVPVTRWPVELAEQPKYPLPAISEDDLITFGQVLYSTADLDVRSAA